MDFFDDSNLFVGGLEGLDEEGFASGPSLVDELNLSADFEPLQVEPLGPGKRHQGMMPPTSSTSSQQQPLPGYEQQMGHYNAIKAQNPMGQPFHGSGGTSDGAGGGGIMAQQHGQYHGTSIAQAPQSNGMFCNSGSPMWGNQDQNGNMYLPLSQQQQPQQLHQHHQQQQLHDQQLQRRPQQPQQQQHHPCQQQQQQQQQQRLQQLHQQQNHHQQMMNQRQHHQMNPQALAVQQQQQQQHHNFPFHPGSHLQSQVHHSQPLVQQQLTLGGSRFHSRAAPTSGDLPSKSYMESQNGSLGLTPLQQHQQQGGYQLARGAQAFPGSGPEDPSLSFSMQSSSMAHTLPVCSVTSPTAYRPSQYPAYPGEPEIPRLSQQNLPSASVPRSNTATTTAALHTSTVPELSGPGCEFTAPPSMGHHLQQQPPQALVSQAKECPYRPLHCSGQTPGSYSSKEMFGQDICCYPSVAGQLPPEQPQSCGATASVPAIITTTSSSSSATINGYQGMEERLLSAEAQGRDFEGLEAPDLLPDLLPQLEAALSQQDESNGSWDNGSQEEGEDRKPPLLDYQEEKVMNQDVDVFCCCL